MKQVKSISSLREQLATVRQSGKKIALVPTMGNLHAGHLSLVNEVKPKADFIVVSLFVNPTQFVEGEDFDSYPRTLASDIQSLENLDVDLVFIPNSSEIYPDGNEIDTQVSVPELESIYCGKFRPGHFQGVATVVSKLFNIVQPDLAIFGIKDYQQLLVIRRLVKNLNFPIDIIGSATVREKDGLAMSSRNQYLSETEREKAPLLYKCICEMANAINNGNDNYAKLEENAVATLVNAGFKPEYISVCDSETLKAPNNQKLVIIAAVWLGNARLIDNVAVQH